MVRDERAPAGTGAGLAIATSRECVRVGHDRHAERAETRCLCGETAGVGTSCGSEDCEKEWSVYLAQEKNRSRNA